MVSIRKTVPTIYRVQSTVHNTVLKNLKTSKDVAAAPLFKTKVKLSNQLAAAADYSAAYRTLKQKYGAKPDGLADTYVELARELPHEAPQHSGLPRSGHRGRGGA